MADHEHEYDYDEHPMKVLHTAERKSLSRIHRLAKEPMLSCMEMRKLKNASKALVAIMTAKKAYKEEFK